MIWLAAIGLILYRLGWKLLLTLLLAGFTAIILIQNDALMLGLLKCSEHLPRLAQIARSIRLFYESAYILLQWRPLLLAICISLISWSGECGVLLYFVNRGLGVAASSDLLIKSMFILAVSSLIGSTSGLPGELGTGARNCLGKAIDRGTKTILCKEHLTV